MPHTNQKFPESLLISPYLTRLSTAYDVPAKVTVKTLENLINQLTGYSLLDNDHIATDISEYLVERKSEFALYWSIAFSAKTISFEDLGRLQSQFSDATIDLALKAAWRSSDLRQVAKLLPKDQDLVPGLFVLGLGKLGGLDLNFSSDVDLVAYFDPELLPVPTTIGQGYIVNKVLQNMTRILQPNNQIDFVWRVDWRLRPDSSSSLLALSTLVAEEYYFFKALPWHRLALMKARVIAGDHACGQEFLRTLHPFIWRQNLDFRALDELAHIKKRINLEHPGLRYQRAAQQAITQDCAGFNAKLGSGGIREIEFIVNALQLVWGGKTPQLRVTNTLQALQQLINTQHFDKVDAQQLIESYRYLRHLENAIQMLNNAQTHLVPTEQSLQYQLLVLLDLLKGSSIGEQQDELFTKAWNDLSEQVLLHRQRVNDMFTDFFNDDSVDHSDYEFPDGWEDELSDRAKAIVTNWTSGFTDYGLPNTMSVMVDPMSNQLLKAVFEAQADANESFVRIDQFLQSIPNPEQYFRLLIAEPKLVESIVPPLLHSPHMGVLLQQSLHIVDGLLDPSNSVESLLDETRLEERSNFIFLTSDYGVRLERLRRFVNEHLYQYYLYFIQDDWSVHEFQQALTKLAEQTLDCAICIAQDDLDIPPIPIVVLGMGKLAMSRMSPLSDLDLVFIFADDYALETAQKVVSRLQTILSMQLKEGIAYELDTRLRPSGRSGPPTVFLGGFREYHVERAKNWEHIALLPSRIVAGDAALGEQVMQIKKDIFSSKRDPKQWLADAEKMWRRVEEQRIEPMDKNVVNSKLRRGGLMQSEYLAVCYCLEALAEPDFFAQHEIMIDDFHQLLDGVENNQPTQEPYLNKAIHFWSVVQIWERILGLSDKSYSDIPEQYLGLLLKQVGCESLEDFFLRAEQDANVIAKAMDDYFFKNQMTSDELENWQESKVQWL